MKMVQYRGNESLIVANKVRNTIEALIFLSSRNLQTCLKPRNLLFLREIKSKLAVDYHYSRQNFDSSELELTTYGLCLVLIKFFFSPIKYCSKTSRTRKFIHIF